MKDSFNRAIKDGVFDGYTYEKLMQAYKNVGEGKGSGTENAGFMALIGDIGGAIMDYKPNDLSDKNKLYKEVIAKCAKVLFPKLKEEEGIKNILDSADAIKLKRGSNAIAASKRDERENSKEPASSRVGILPTGTNIDDEIKEAKNKEKIKAAKWPKQLIKFERIKSSKEPWAGHMSSSILELLFVFDLITGNDPLISYKEKEDSKILETTERKARAAISSAFLIGIGYHSALEVYEVVSTYLGRDDRKKNTNLKVGQDIANIQSIRDGEATKYIDQILIESTELPKRKFIKK
jgi:hypothetical protein